MPEILTTPLGTKFIQPEIPLVNAMAQKAIKEQYQPGDLIECLHPLSKGTIGKILEVLPKSIIFQPEGTNHEQYLTFDQFRKYSPPKTPSKTCRDCGNGKHGSYDTHCQIIDQQVYPENQACSEFVQKSSPSCRDCHHFDSSVPEKSPYQFCLLDGTYLTADSLSMWHSSNNE